MKNEPDFSDNLGPKPTSVHARLEVVAGRVMAQMGTPTAAQKRFNKLMASIEATRAESEAVQRVVDNRRSGHFQVMQTLAQQLLQLQKEMVHFLDQRLQQSGLTAKQKQQTTHLLLGLCDQLIHLNDPALEAVVARHRCAEDVAEREQDEAAAAEETKAFIADFLGKGFSPDSKFSTPEEVLKAAMDHMHAQEADRVAKRDARKAKKAPTAREKAAAEQQNHVQNTLRTLFRQLASALHPDRAEDAADRVRKTALMSEVNAAYGRKDLTALLRIQLQCEEIDASKLASLSEDKLKAMCVLLNEQHKAMQEDLMSQRMALAHDFGYSPHVRFTEAEFEAVLNMHQSDLAEQADFMRADLAEVQDDKGFKAWLKLQTRLSKAQSRDDQASMGMEDMLYEMMSRRF